MGSRDANQKPIGPGRLQMEQPALGGCDLEQDKQYST